MISGICHFNLRAPRPLLDTLRSFYCDLLGLSLGPRPPFSSFGYWLYAGDKDILHLTEAPSTEARVTGVSTTFDHVAFTCSDWPSYEAKLTAQGVPFTTSTVPDTGQFQVFFRDPAGNGVELNFARGDA
jgi:catechol 2,3-dioxygenase-like lactoylglutathione lyase family enzyme